MPTSLSEQYKLHLARYLPAGAVEGIYDILNTHAVRLHITRERHSKLGDYRWPQRNHEGHEISVNGNMGPYMFLSVMLHEVAHLDTRLQYDGRVAPHGHEWQQNYARRLRQFRHCFPSESLALLDRYVSRIPLHRRTGEEFEQVLKRYNPDYTPAAELHLDDLPPGTLFRIAGRPSPLFRSLERRRTRWLCQDTATARQYLVRGASPVVVPESHD